MSSEKWEPSASKESWRAYEKAYATSVMKQVDLYRRRYEVTVEGLCRLLDGLGWPVTTSTMNGMLGGKRSAITVTEVAMFARALGVTPILLIHPLVQGGELPALPSGQGTATPFELAEWFTGDDVTAGMNRGKNYPVDANLYHRMKEVRELERKVVTENAELIAYLEAGIDGRDLRLFSMSHALVNLAAMRSMLGREKSEFPTLREALELFIENDLERIKADDLPILEVLPIQGLNTAAELDDARNRIRKLLTADSAFSASLAGAAISLRRTPNVPSS